MQGIWVDLWCHSHGHWSIIQGEALYTLFEKRQTYICWSNNGPVSLRRLVQAWPADQHDIRLWVAICIKDMGLPMQANGNKSKAIHSISSGDQRLKRECQSGDRTIPEKLRQSFSRWLDASSTTGRTFSHCKRFSHHQSATVSSDQGL